MNHNTENGSNQYDPEQENDGLQLGSLLTGLLVGGLAGAVAMLMLAPQSGKKTRTKLQQKSIELRGQATDAVEAAEAALAHARTKAYRFSTGAQKRAHALQHHGQAVLTQQKEHWSELVDAGKAALQGA
jgi:gas vesicle protein